MTRNFTPVPDKVDGDTFTVPMWETFLKANMNLGFAQLLADPIIVPTGTPAATIEFASIPQTFAHLKLIVCAFSDAAATSVGLQARVNGHTGLTYNDEVQTLVGTAVAGAQDLLASSWTVGFMPGASAAVGGIAGIAEILIPYYANPLAGGFPTFHSRGYAAWNSTSATQKLWTAGGHCEGTALPVTDVKLFPSSGNFVGVGGLADTIAWLYGLPE